MVLTSKKTEKELLEKLSKMVVGDSMNLTSPFPAIPDEVQAFVVLKEDETYWVLEAFWHGISMGELSAELKDGNLILEQL